MIFEIGNNNYKVSTFVFFYALYYLFLGAYNKIFTVYKGTCVDKGKLSMVNLFGVFGPSIYDTDEGCPENNPFFSFDRLEIITMPMIMIILGVKLNLNPKNDESHKTMIPTKRTF